MITREAVGEPIQCAVVPSLSTMVFGSFFLVLHMFR
jgi:hypothetical protein